MSNIVSKLFFFAGLIAYLVFLVDRGKSFGIPDYSQDATIIALLGVLAHCAFERTDGTS